MSKTFGGKYEPTLIYSSLLKALAEVRRYGIQRYGNSEDWREVSTNDFLDAFMRHSIAFALDGEETDKDSGLPHMYLALGNLAYLIERRHGKAHGGVVKYRREAGNFGSDLDVFNTVEELAAQISESRNESED